MGITLTEAADRLVWTQNRSDGMVTAKLAYEHIFLECTNFGEDWWANFLWRWKVPLKLKCFFWLVLHNRLLTWDNLCLRGWQGPSLCYLCNADNESVLHLFIRCPFALKIWDYIITEMRLVWNRNNDTMGELFNRWTRTFRKYKGLFIFVCWGIWRCRNNVIFNGIQSTGEQIGAGIIGHFLECGVEEQRTDRGRRIIEPLVIEDYPVGFFDGAAQEGRGGYGFFFG